MSNDRSEEERTDDHSEDGRTDDRSEPGGTLPDRSKGATYEHEDGTVDTVFYNDGSRVLVVREYPTVGRFDRSIGDATYVGSNELVESIQIPISPEEESAADGTDTEDTH